MLSMRLQRTGRRGLAQFRLIVQDSRRSPTSGRVVVNLGHYNPHTKEHGFNLELAKQYLSNGTQPSERVAKLLSDNGVKLPTWVAKPRVKKAAPKQKQAPTEQVAEAPSEADEAKASTKDEQPDPDKTDEAEPADKVEEAKADKQPKDEPVADQPQEPKADKDQPAPAKTDETKPADKAAKPKADSTPAAETKPKPSKPKDKSSSSQSSQA